jgi:hypothetical protein
MQHPLSVFDAIGLIGLAGTVITIVWFFAMFMLTVCINSKLNRIDRNLNRFLLAFEARPQNPPPPIAQLNRVPGTPPRSEG